MLANRSIPFDKLSALSALSEKTFNLPQGADKIQHQKKWRQKRTERAPQQYIAPTVGSHKTTDCTRYNDYDKKEEHRDDIISHFIDPPEVRLFTSCNPQMADCCEIWPVSPAKKAGLFHGAENSAEIKEARTWRADYQALGGLLWEDQGFRAWLILFSPDNI